MDVDTYSWLLKSDCPDQIGGLASHSRQFQQVVNLMRNISVKLFLHQRRKFLKVLGLGLVESDRINEFAQLSLRYMLQILQLTHLPKQSLAHDSSRLILGARRQYSRNKHLEGILGLDLDQIDDRDFVVDDLAA